MKKIIAASLVALGLAAFSPQEAQAWCKFSCSFGFSFHCESGCCGCGCAPGCFDCGCIAGFGPPVLPYAPGYGADFGYGGYSCAAAQPAPAASTAPAASPPANGPAQASYFSNVGGTSQGYSYYGNTGAYSGYGSGQAPSYWYGY
jgi:hypothetical protein